MSQSSNTTESAARRGNFRIVSSDGSMVAPALSQVQRASTAPTSPAITQPRLSVAGCDGADWDAMHAVDSTHGEAPKQKKIEFGKVFSNAVNEYLTANPGATYLIAMAHEFERAFVEAANAPVEIKNTH